MNLAHVHLLLNHFPTIAFGIGLGLFLVALVRKSEELRRASLVIFFLIAAISIPTYFSGNGAEELVRDRPDISVAAIRVHEDAALLAFIFMEITGFISWLALWQFRLISRTPGWSLPAILVLSAITFGFMARAANLGGAIHHPEIEVGTQTANNGDTGTNGDTPVPTGVARSIGAFVNAHTWVWPSCETLHFVGLSILFTVVLIVDLRMLGMAKSVSFSALYQLLPLGMLGFSINLLTGMMFFVATPEQYTKNVAFYWKVAFIIIAAFNVLYFMLLDEAWEVGPGDDASVMAKVAAASAIFLWIGVLFWGHMLPFIGNSF